MEKIKKITHISRHGYPTEVQCYICKKPIKPYESCYIAGYGLDEHGNSFIGEETDPICSIDCAERASLLLEMIENGINTEGSEQISNAGLMLRIAQFYAQKVYRGKTQ